MKKGLFNILGIFIILAFFSGDLPNHSEKNKELLPNSYQDDLDKENCTFKGMKLYGKIKFVENYPDIKIKFVDNFPDIKVKFVENFPDDCGEWKVVANFPDLKVKVVGNFPGMD